MATKKITDLEKIPTKKEKENSSENEKTFSDHSFKFIDEQ